MDDGIIQKWESRGKGRAAWIMKREQRGWKKRDLWGSTALLREKRGSEPADASVGRGREALPADQDTRSTLSEATGSSPRWDKDFWDNHTPLRVWCTNLKAHQIISTIIPTNPKEAVAVPQSEVKKNIIKPYFSPSDKLLTPLSGDSCWKRFKCFLKAHIGSSRCTGSLKALTNGRLGTEVSLCPRVSPSPPQDKGGQALSSTLAPCLSYPLSGPPSRPTFLSICKSFTKTHLWSHSSVSPTPTLCHNPL